MSEQTMKQQVAKAALDYVKSGDVIGVGTGSTVNFFIEQLAGIKHKIEGAVASSKATAQLLKDKQIPILDLNTVKQLDVYVDGADEVNQYGQMIKGGGGALTGEKIIAHCAKQFVCIVGQNKWVDTLGAFPVAVEVIPMARSYVARELVKLGGSPEYRHPFTTDHGHVILDTRQLDLLDPLSMEKNINNIAGVVANGIFAARLADIILISDGKEIKTVKSSL